MYRICAIFVASVFLLSGCVLIAPVVTVPHANYKISVPKGTEKAETLMAIDRVLTDMGFTLLENDWQVWEPILEKERLDEKKQERRYKKENFELFYGVMYQANAQEFIRLSFYENGGRRFTESGIKLYYEILDAFLANRLVLLEETAEDVKMSRPVVTPEQFNLAHPALSIAGNAKIVLGYVVSATIYVAIILLPAWILLKKLLFKRARSVATKRIIMTAIPAFVLFPMPMPLSIVGPSLLAPGFLFLFVFTEALAGYREFALLSVAGTFALSLVVSFWLIKKAPNNQLNQDAPKSGAPVS